MADVALYFDGSGFGGTAGPESDWAAVVGWQEGLGSDQYPALAHLVANGWEDDLPALEADIRTAIEKDPPPENARASLEEFLSVVEDRAEGDSAVAIALSGDGGGSDDPPPPPVPALNPEPAANARMPSKMLNITPEKACVLPGQVVQGRITAASKARYAGRAAQISTASGVRLRVTANHPVLTVVGFVAAGDLREGQYLLHYVGENEPPPADDNVQHAPATAEEVFETLAAFGAETGEVSRLDFHGDAAFFQGQVEVVRADGALRCDGVAEAAEVLPQGGFGREGEGEAALPGGGGAGQVFGVLASSRVSLVGGTDHRGPLIIGHKLPTEFAGSTTVAEDPYPLECAVDDSPADAVSGSQLIRGQSTEVALGESSSEFLTDVNPVPGVEGAYYFGLAAELDVPRSKPVSDGASTDAVLARQLCECYPSKVVRDQVVKVEVFHYQGPVYDFQSTTGYIVVEGLLTSNCKILKDGSVRGKPLTERQRGLFGVICGRRGKPTGNVFHDPDLGLVANVKTKKEGPDELSADDYAYVPDPDMPSTWKLRIDDARHVAAACAAIGPGYRGQKADIPESAIPTVKRKLRAAWKHFYPDKGASEMPEVIRNEDGGQGDVDYDLALAELSLMAQDGELDAEALVDNDMPTAGIAGNRPPTGPTSQSVTAMSRRAYGASCRAHAASMDTEYPPAQSKEAMDAGEQAVGHMERGEVEAGVAAHHRAMDSHRRAARYHAERPAMSSATTQNQLDSPDASASSAHEDAATTHGQVIDTAGNVTTTVADSSGNVVAGAGGEGMGDYAGNEYFDLEITPVGNEGVEHHCQCGSHTALRGVSDVSLNGLAGGEGDESDSVLLDEELGLPIPPWSPGGTRL